MLSDSSNDGARISVGVPSFIHMESGGEFYLNGIDERSCLGVKPQCFRLDMNKLHFKEFYSWILYMSAQKKSSSCTVREVVEKVKFGFITAEDV
jgi:hypothetical protein